MDDDIERVAITKVSHGFYVEIYYTNGKMAAFSCDGFDLKNVFYGINQQNKEVHRAVA